MSDGSVEYERIIADLKSLLGELKIDITPPKSSQLLQNYPNPFNPETWIPYQLAEAASVTLTIYDGGGQLVRTIEVGHQVAGTYVDRSKAI